MPGRLTGSMNCDTEWIEHSQFPSNGSTLSISFSYWNLQA
jgi:hypothetical protein